MGGIRKYYTRNGVKVAEFVRFLGEGECGCGYDSQPNYFVDGSMVYRKLINLV